VNNSTEKLMRNPEPLCGQTSPSRGFSHRQRQFRKKIFPMNETTNQTAPKTFDIIGSNTLMAQEYKPLQFAVEKILSHGLFILAGSGKIGKSWLSLDLCVNVVTGDKLWEFSSDRGDVL
jgi:RecA-family ATPase